MLKLTVFRISFNIHIFHKLNILVDGLVSEKERTIGVRLLQLRAETNSLSFQWKG